MSRYASQPDLDEPPAVRSGDSIELVESALVARAGQTLPGSAAVTPHRPHSATPARPAELRWLLGTTIDQNRNLTARVRTLEAELRKSSAELAKLRGELRGAVQDALTDPLTGLANRRSFDLELRAVGARASPSSPAHLAMVDIDHFKRVNDAHGHDTGDEVLRIVGKVLLANVRRDALVARVGGDEFGLLLPATSLRDTGAIAMRLCERLAARPLVLRRHPEVVERVTLSIGVAGCLTHESETRWCARADAALYEAKNRGRNRIIVAATL